MSNGLLLTIFLITGFCAVTFAQSETPVEDCRIEIDLEEYSDSIRLELNKTQKDLAVKNEVIDSLTSLPNYNFFYHKNVETRFSKWSWVLVVTPIIFLFVFLFWATNAAKGFDLKAALSEIKVIDKGTEKEKVQVESSSRLIVFISGVVALTLSFTLILTSLYVYLNTGIVPDFSKLVDAVLALGVGVFPYTINKVAGIFKSNNT